MKNILACLALMLSLSSFAISKGIGIALIVTAGDYFCDYTSIHAAIDDVTANSEIRVTNTDIFPGNLTVDKNLTIKGGYTSYENAQNDIRVDGEKTTIDGNDSTNVLFIVDDDINLEMSAFILTKGINDGAHFGGAITVEADNINVILTDVIIQNSHAGEGAGIVMYGSGIILTLNHSLILNNIAGVMVEVFGV